MHHALRLLILQALLAVALSLPATAQRLVSTGQGFELAASPDGADTRSFSSADKLHMRVFGPALVPTADGTGSGGAGLEGRWILERPGTVLEGPLQPSESRSFTAAFDLALLPPESAAWTWRAELTDGGTLLWSPTTSLEITLPPPTAAFDATPTQGQSPLTVAFQDRSTCQFPITVYANVRPR